MNKRHSIYAIIACAASIFAAGCNDDDDIDDVMIPDASGNAVMVNSFNIQPDDSVLAALDSVFFSIDLDRAVIFNADSLPVGTRVNRLCLNIGLPAVKTAEITMPDDKGADTVVNYLTNPNDSINFSKGSVRLRLESTNGLYERNYTIFVNVHKVNPDSMSWSTLAPAGLPTSLSNVDAQHTVEYQGKTLCFTRSGSDYCRATAINAITGQWDTETVALPAGARMATLTAGTSSLFICDSSDRLFVSSDAGATWTATGTSMTHIYGTLDDKVIGVRRDASSYTHVTYPATTEATVEAACPVSGTSPALVYTSDWSSEPMMIVTGGITADGSVTGQTWAYDGTQWAAISVASIPASDSPVVIPYYAFKTSTSWRVTKSSVLLAFGGIAADGTPQRTVYVSKDFGVHWEKASQLMQMPASAAVGKQAQAILIDRTISSRAVKPITEWQCPYIYVFGGCSANGVLDNRIMRGVINRLTFKPLQ